MLKNHTGMPEARKLFLGVAGQLQLIIIKKCIPYFTGLVSLLAVSLAQAQSIEVLHLTWDPSPSNPGDIADYPSLTASAWGNGSEVGACTFGCPTSPSSNFADGYAEITAPSPHLGFQWGFEGDLTVVGGETIDVTHISFDYEVLGHNGDAQLIFSLGTYSISVPLPSTEVTISQIFGTTGSVEVATGLVTIDLVNGTYTVTYSGSDGGSGDASGSFATPGAYALSGGTTLLDILVKRVPAGVNQGEFFDANADSANAIEGAYYRIDNFTLWIAGFNAAAGVYETIPSALLGNSRLPGFFQRVGNRVWMQQPDDTQVLSTVYCKDASRDYLCEITPEQDSYYADADSQDVFRNTGRGLWIRLNGARNEVSPAITTTGTSYERSDWGVQAGTDFVLGEMENGTLIGGLNVHFGEVQLDAFSLTGNGAIASTEFGIGASLTWLGKQGFYADGQLQFSRVKSDISAAGPGVLTTGNSGKVQAISLEVGKRFVRNNGWSVTPQVQVSRASSDFDTFTDTLGDSVSSVDGDRTTLRLGVSVERERKSGDSNRAFSYGFANLYHDLDGRTSVSVSGSELISETDGWIGEAGFGGEYIWGRNGTRTNSVYGELALSSGLGGSGDYSGIRGSLGVRISW